MNQAAWLALRVVLAIVLMIGFYVLAIVMVGGLLWIPYAEWTYLHRVDPRLALGCVIAAFGLLAALLPRRDRFEPPGPQIDEQAEPRLFAFIREVADATRQPMPKEIYVVNEVNAWVAQRGGTMGFGSRRVMGIGLPLLQALPATEVKSVVAHEFGHYASSDVMLAPWIYVTRAAIGRTMNALDDSWLGKPFVWYGQLFMRLTSGVSRRQEFVADQMSARVVGAEVAARALRNVAAIAPGYHLYAQSEVVPVLQAGFVPPIGEGFLRFLQTDWFRDLTARVHQHEAGERDQDAYDSHPPLRERLAALGVGDVPSMPVLAPGPPLLADPDRYIVTMLTRSMSDDEAAALRPIAWERVADEVYAAQWRRFVAAHISWLALLTFETLPRSREALLTFARGINIPGGIENERRAAYASALISAAVTLVMIDKGWRLEKAPGRGPMLTKDDESVEPFALIDDVVRGKDTEGGWSRIATRHGLSGSLLSSTTGISEATVATLAAGGALPAPENDSNAAARRRRRSW